MKLRASIRDIHMERTQQPKQDKSRALESCLHGTHNGSAVPSHCHQAKAGLDKGDHLTGASFISLGPPQAEMNMQKPQTAESK